MSSILPLFLYSFTNQVGRAVGMTVEAEEMQDHAGLLRAERDEGQRHFWGFFAVTRWIEGERDVRTDHPILDALLVAGREVLG